MGARKNKSGAQRDSLDLISGRALAAPSIGFFLAGMSEIDIVCVRGRRRGWGFGL